MGIAHDVMTEHPRDTSLVQEQRRKNADQRGLAGAVLTQDGDGLTARNTEGDVVERIDGTTGGLALAACVLAGHLAAKRLTQPDDINGIDAVAFGRSGH